MTREELLERGDETVTLRQLVERFEAVEEEYSGIPWTLTQIYTQIDMLVSEKPCEDCISRQAALGCCRNEWEEEVEERLRALPPVTPQPKMGYWVRMSDLSEDADDRYKCSKCGNVVHSTDRINLYTFHRWCGRCGSNNDVTKMQEVEE